MQKKLDAFKHIGASRIDCLLERVAVVEKRKLSRDFQDKERKNCATTDCMCVKEREKE